MISGYRCWGFVLKARDMAAALAIFLSYPHRLCPPCFSTLVSPLCLKIPRCQENVLLVSFSSFYPVGPWPGFLALQLRRLDYCAKGAPVVCERDIKWELTALYKTQGILVKVGGGHLDMTPHVESCNFSYWEITLEAYVYIHVDKLCVYMCEWGKWELGWDEWDWLVPGWPS